MLKQLYQREYWVWVQMRQRCNNPRHKQYEDYGGRGIRVCTRWNSFLDFFLDMGDRPAGLTLERINNNKGYTPGNCRWASRAEQNRNTRSVKLSPRVAGQIRKLYSCGRTQTSLAAEFGVTQQQISFVVRRKSWA